MVQVGVAWLVGRVATPNRCVYVCHTGNIAKPNRCLHVCHTGNIAKWHAQDVHLYFSPASKELHVAA